MLSRSPEFCGHERIKHDLSGGARIIKTHSHADIQSFFGETDEAKTVASEIFERAKVIYVCRHPLDVLWSQFLYQSRFHESIKKVGFDDYVRQENGFDSETYDGCLDRVEYWAYHMRGWTAVPDVLTLTFEEMIGQYRSALRRIAEFVGELAPQHVINARRNGWIAFLGAMRQMRVIGWLATRIYWRLDPDPIRTSVCLRRGRCGDGVTAASAETREYVQCLTRGLWPPPKKT